MIPYKHINVLIIPTDFCNMNCIYCFNSRKNNAFHERISFDTLQKVFECIIPFYDRVRFIWHGGEPVSMGVDFYRKALEMQRTVNKDGAMIENSIQSNLTLLDEESVRFFIDNKIHIGGSFDGTRNELTRHNTAAILRGRDLIKNNGSSVGFICVLQSRNVDHLIADYEWFKSNGINYSLNLYLCPPPYEEDPLFVPADKCIAALCNLYDYWSRDAECNIRLSYFDEYVRYMLLGEKSLCCYNSCLGKYIGIHCDGSIYNCNRDFAPEYCYGSIFDYKDIHECFSSKGFMKSVNDAYLRRAYCKSNCSIFGFCAGGCNSCAAVCGDYSKPNDYFCKISRAVYSHIEKDLRILLDNSFDKAAINPILKELLEYCASPKSSASGENTCCNT